jgi:hypothetical protein
MGRIPFKSRIPVYAWLLAAFFTFVSTISSLLGGPEASGELTLAQLVK